MKWRRGRSHEVNLGGGDRRGVIRTGGAASRPVELNAARAAAVLLLNSVTRPQWRSRRRWPRRVATNTDRVP